MYYLECLWSIHGRSVRTG